MEVEWDFSLSLGWVEVIIQTLQVLQDQSERILHFSRLRIQEIKWGHSEVVVEAEVEEMEEVGVIVGLGMFNLWKLTYGNCGIPINADHSADYIEG